MSDEHHLLDLQVELHRMQARMIIMANDSYVAADELFMLARQIGAVETQLIAELIRMPPLA